MLPQHLGDGVRQRHQAVPVVLWQAEDEPGANEFDLTRDVHPSGVEVDVIDAEPQNLALAQPAAGTQVDHGTVPAEAPPQRRSATDTVRNRAPT